MHKMCSDERICAVMKGCLCSDELRRNKWCMQYQLLREHKARCINVKTVCGCVYKGCIVRKNRNRIHHVLNRKERGHQNFREREKCVIYTFYSSLKTLLFSRARVGSASE